MEEKVEIIIIIVVIIPKYTVQKNLLFKHRLLGISSQQQDALGCNSSVVTRRK